MKTKTILIAAVMCLAFSAAAFAQSTFTVGSVPITAVADSGQTEKTGDITFSNYFSGTDTITGTITISYGVPITIYASSINFPTNGLGLTVNSINNFTGTLVLNVPAGYYGTATVSGVRVATAGSKLSSLSATISTTGNALISGQTEVKVITSVIPGLASFAADMNYSTFQQIPIKINAVTGISSSTTLSITEGFLDAFGLTKVTDPTQTANKMLRITLSQLPPKGVTITFPQYASTYVLGAYGYSELVHYAFQAIDSDGDLADGNLQITSDSDSTIYYQLVKDTDPTQLETLRIPISASVDYTATLPLPQINISASVTLAPIKAAFPPPGTAPYPFPYASPIPRYAVEEVGTASILNIYPSSTTLLIPYATTAFGYNTGIAIANTTVDPGVAAMGFGGAVAQSGKIIFYFYPNKGGTPFSLSTSDYPNATAGTDAKGVVAGGGMYTITLSELLNALGKTDEFTGYIIAVCNFSNAHGQYFISDFEYFTNGAQALVITTSRSGASGEGLAQ